MPSDDTELQAVASRLNALVRCVLAKAESDASFAGQLKELLLSDSLRVTVRSEGNKPRRRAVFDPVAFLSQHGVESLRQNLAERPKSELAEIARQLRVVPPKVVKGLDRDELNAKLVAHAEQKLSQGAVFLKSSGNAEHPHAKLSDPARQASPGSSPDVLSE